MVWHARLDLTYTARAAQAPESPKTVMQFEHDGPLRVLKSLYPEGPGICHNVLVHPPGGLVSGDTLDVQVDVAANAHALITTPGATRFYKSAGAPALQRTRLRLAAGARLEWLPLEAIAYNACDARNTLEMHVAEGAQLLTWDVTALGLPMADLAFTSGRFVQHIEWPGHFLEHGEMNASDALLMDGPLGLAGHRCIASLMFVSGTAIDRSVREAVLERTHALLPKDTAPWAFGVTAPNPHMLVLRGLAPVVEPVMAVWRSVWAMWRSELWGLPAAPPRIWAM